jgi:6 kDa early secretory antigenic target
MTDPNFMHIRFETLEQAQTDLAAAYVAAHKEIDDLKNKIDKLLMSRTGPAHEAYVAASDDWRRAFEHMQAVLERAKIHIGSAYEMFVEVERQNVSVWHS